MVVASRSTREAEFGNVLAMLTFSALRDREILAPVLGTVLDAVVAMDRGGVIVGWNDQAAATFGWSASEAEGRKLEDLIVPVRHRDAHRTGLARMLAGGEPRVLNRRIEISALRKDGDEIPVELAITRADGCDGEVFVGFLRDISKRKSDEVRLKRQATETRVLFEIASLASEADSFEAALEAALKGICELSGWPVGHAFVVPDPGTQLVSSDIWIERNPGEADDLKQATNCGGFVMGRGLPGTVLMTAEPVWVADTDRSGNFPRKGLGFRSAFGFPLKAQGSVIAVLEFFCEDPQQPDPDLLLTVRTLGEQAGRVFERKRTEDRQKLLLGELNHRVKNTMAIVKAVIAQTFRSARSSEETETIINSRLDAIARAHELLTAERWTKASMTDIIHAALESCGASPDRVRIDGRDFNVRAETAVTISLAIHELCTNAFKYGALSSEGGSVQIGWTLTDESPPKFAFEWVERGGPTVMAPKASGFGSRLLRSGLGGLGGTVALAYEPQGFRMNFVAPLPAVPSIAGDEVAKD